MFITHYNFRYFFSHLLFVYLHFSNFQFQIFFNWYFLLSNDIPWCLLTSFNFHGFFIVITQLPILLWIYFSLSWLVGHEYVNNIDYQVRERISRIQLCHFFWIIINRQHYLKIYQFLYILAASYYNLHRFITLPMEFQSILSHTNKLMNMFILWKIILA